MNKIFSGYVRNMEADRLAEIFLISAIASLLGIRFFLSLTGYPKLGSGQFHIAHMLWGGLFMLAAIFLSLYFLNRHSKVWAALIGGIGFGMFIDELGKFITSDNNYFFQPAVALIYVIFILIFLAIKAGKKYMTISPEGYAVNALEVIKELAAKGIDESEKQHALSLLSKSSQDSPVVHGLKAMLLNVSAAPSRGPGWFDSFKRWLGLAYLRLLKTTWFINFTMWTFGIFASANFINALAHASSSSIFWWGNVLASAASVGMVFYGIKIIRSENRLKAYQILNFSVLISIFFTQFFVFLREQFAGLITLAVSLAFYIACQYLIEQEKSLA